MKLYIDQFSQHLSKGLAPIYFISGDEPLQMKESLDAIRATARQQGYTGREILERGRDFDWNHLMSSANTMSLFAEKRIIELRMATGKPGKEGGQVLSEYAQNPPDDTLLLITSAKLDKSTQNTKWYKTLERAGVVMQVWPVKLSKMPAWISQRLRAKYLKVDSAGVRLLCDRVEGNLLAASQEIEKLSLLFGEDQNTTTLTVEQIAYAVSDSSRYNIYDLAEAALMGQLARSVKILNGLQAEGVASTLVLWVLSNEIRTTAQLSRKLAQGQKLQQLLSQVWESRKATVSSALTRVPQGLWDRLLQHCAYTDQVIKGIQRGSAWELLQQLVLMLCEQRLAFVEQMPPK